MDHLSTPLLGNSDSHEAIENTSYAHENELLDKGYLKYGCTHMARRCRIKAPCCNEIFNCEYCHDELKNNVLEKDKHQMLREQTSQVVCSLCNTEQEFQQICINCGVCMGRYICEICKKISDDGQSMTIYHCFSCGECRQSRKVFQISHCDKCQCCRSKTHTCIEGVLHRDCPICFEYLSEMRGSYTSFPCGHMIHDGCFLKLNRNTCPFCSKKFSYMFERNTTWRLQLPRFLNIFNTNC